MDAEKIRRQVLAAMTILESILDGLPEKAACVHENIAPAAGNTMGEGNQKYYCQDCGEEVSEDEWIRSQEC